MIRRSAVLLTMALFAAPAVAQQATSDPTAIGRCLCLQQELDARASAVTGAKANLDQARGAADHLTQDVERQRSQVPANDAAAVAAFTDLLHRSEDAAARLNSAQIPAYNAAVSAYNRSTDAYTRECAGKSFDVAALDKAKTNLVCPKP
jgi:hypothetical protein